MPVAARYADKSIGIGCESVGKTISDLVCGFFQYTYFGNQKNYNDDENADQDPQNSIITSVLFYLISFFLKKPVPAPVAAAVMTTEYAHSRGTFSASMLVNCTV